jgi:hypothetical protein
MCSRELLERRSGAGEEKGGQWQRLVLFIAAQRGGGRVGGGRPGRQE